MIEQGEEYWAGFADGVEKNRDDQIKLLLNMVELLLKKTTIKDGPLYEESAVGFPENHIERVDATLNLFDETRRAYATYAWA